ncbi:hypothetical protein H0H93_015754, partial [Arthromyces matolae]
LPPRRSTVTSAPAAAAPPPQPSHRQASGQYPPPPQAQAASQPTASGVAPANNGNGVWADLISLQSPSSSSSLPLQFQAPSQLSPIIPQGYQTSLVTGLNPFQQQPAISNPYSQQIYPNAGPSSATAYPSPSPFTPQHTLPFAAQQPLMQNTSNIFHPQPHQAMQTQVPTTGQTLFNVQTGAMMGPSTNPGPFLSTSPASSDDNSPAVVLDDPTASDVHDDTATSSSAVGTVDVHDDS